MEWADGKDSVPGLLTRVEAIMILGIKAQADSIEFNNLHVFVGQEEDRDDEIRRIGALVNSWLMPLYRPVTDIEAARWYERKLHAAIKASSLYRKILNFAGLNIWVDDRTPDGFVESQEAI